MHQEQLGIQYNASWIRAKMECTDSAYKEYKGFIYASVISKKLVLLD